MRLYCAAACAALLTAVPAAAQDATGAWLRDNGEAKARISKCGDGLCGTVVALKDSGGVAKAGQRISIALKPSGDGAWRWNAVNPEDGRNYSGTMKLSGDRLTTAGCGLGGLVCLSANWTRAQ